MPTENHRPTEDKSKHPWERFVPVISVVLGVFLFILQANGVEMTWRWSALYYLALLAASLWTFLKHGIPDRGRVRARWLGALGFCALFLLLGGYGTAKQYERDNAEDLRAVSIVDVSSKLEQAGFFYSFQISTENTTKEDLRSIFMCTVVKPNNQHAPFGLVTRDWKKQQEEEDRIFHEMDISEEKDGKAGEQDLPAGKTVYGYCPSSWIPQQSEIDALHRGEATLYIAGRIILPGKSDGVHRDFEFCRIGGGGFGLQNCYGHNVPRVHLMPHPAP